MSWSARAKHWRAGCSFAWGLSARAGGVLESCPVGNGHRTRIRLRIAWAAMPRLMACRRAPCPPRARVGDVHDLAVQMPQVTIEVGSLGKPVYRSAASRSSASAILARTLQTRDR